MNIKSISKRKRPCIPQKEKSSISILSYFKSHEKKTSPRKTNNKKADLLDHALSDDDVEIVLIEKKSKYFGSPRKKCSSTDDAVHVADVDIAEVQKPKQRKVSLRKKLVQSSNCSKAVQNDDFCDITQKAVGSDSVGATEVNDDAKIMTRSRSCKVYNSSASNKSLSKRKLSLEKLNYGKDVSSNSTLKSDEYPSGFEKYNLRKTVSDTKHVSNNSDHHNFKIKRKHSSEICSRPTHVRTISEENLKCEKQKHDQHLYKDTIEKMVINDVTEEVKRSSAQTSNTPTNTTRSKKRHRTSSYCDNLNSETIHKTTKTSVLDTDVFHNTLTSSQDSCKTSTSDQKLRTISLTVNVSKNISSITEDFVDTPVSSQGDNSTLSQVFDNIPTSSQTDAEDFVDTPVSSQGDNSTLSQVFDNIPTSSQTDAEDEISKRGSTEAEETKYRIPYYLENFQTILSSVLENEDNEYLFDEKDLETISLFSSLSEMSKKLYVRLFSRKLAWLPLSKLKYPEIADDLSDVLQELTDVDLTVSETELTDLEMTLKSLALPDLKTLAKSYHLNVSSKTGIVDILLKKSKQSTIGTMFGAKSKQHDPEAIMLLRAKKLLGRMFRLQEERRKVFVRVLMLFSVLHSTVEDDSANGGQSQLYQMLLVNMGKVIYPTFKVNKQTRLFLDRESFLRFARAMQLESDLSQCVEKADWGRAYEVFTAAKKEYEDLQTHSDLIRWDMDLPCFLRVCSAGFVLVRVLSQGIEILQRRKDYIGAISLIRELLDQQVYCYPYRGYWWERLALNLDVHLKKPTKALDVIGEGLADTHVHVGHRLALYQRAEKICNTASLKVRDRLTDFHHDELVQLPTVTVDGRIMPHAVPGIKNQFITADSHNDDITCCRVEQFVLDHYKQNGYTDGLHAEGSIVSGLFCLFFWDILFMDVPDVFHSRFQTRPLDFHSELFYIQRRDVIENKLEQITDAADEDLHKMMSDVWTSRHGVLCAGMSWDLFTSLEQVQGLVSCVGGKQLAAILRRFVTNPRHTRSGFPDLTLWNTDRNTVKICEVKGPGDRLSHKQILWIDFLVKLGVDAEVCHVRAVGAKKLKPAACIFEQE